MFHIMVDKLQDNAKYFQDSSSGTYCGSVCSACKKTLVDKIPDGVDAATVAIVGMSSPSYHCKEVNRDECSHFLCHVCYKTEFVREVNSDTSVRKSRRKRKAQQLTD